MTILQGIGAANALLRGASNLVREFKQPNVDKAAFAGMLREKLAGTSSPETIEARLIERTENFLRVRDANADGLLSRDESGLNKTLFTRLDADGDGLLSAEELRQPYLEALHKRAGGR